MNEEHNLACSCSVDWIACIGTLYIIIGWEAWHPQPPLLLPSPIILPCLSFFSSRRCRVEGTQKWLGSFTAIPFLAPQGCKWGDITPRIACKDMIVPHQAPAQLQQRVCYIHIHGFLGGFFGLKFVSISHCQVFMEKEARLTSHVQP